MASVTLKIHAVFSTSSEIWHSPEASLPLGSTLLCRWEDKNEKPFEMKILVKS